MSSLTGGRASYKDEQAFRAFLSRLLSRMRPVQSSSELRQLQHNENGRWLLS